MEADLLQGLEKPCTLLTVFPHPDDESFAAGGCLALYARDPEVRCVSLCLSKGGKSGALPKVGLPAEREPVVRENEYMASTSILGVDRAVLWDYEDQGLPLVSEDMLVERISGIIREEGAQVVITYGPDGITGHPDHNTCSKVTERAVKESGVPRLFMVSGPAWMGRVFLRQKLLPVTHGVDIREVYRIKMLALKAHASQMLISMEPMIWVGVIMRAAGKEFFHRRL
ncbi:MAG: PIG-L deacetylase family protein [bacterium]